MAKFDAAEVSQLLQIPALVTTNAPPMQAILSEAMSRLNAINSGLAEEKARRNHNPHQHPGMPTDGQPAVPSQPVEAPKSEAAKDAPKPAPFPDNGPRAVPNTQYEPGPMPGVKYEDASNADPVRRV